METDPRLKYGCGESGDLIADGQRLVIGGARLKDGPMIKEGINRLKQAGYPLNVIILLSRALIRDYRQSSQND